MWEVLFFSISILSGLGIVSFVFASAIDENFQFWPPPEKSSWQSKTFRALFRGMLYPLIALSLIVYQFPKTQFDVALMVVGITLLVLGFGAAFMSTFSLGWKNAFGDNSGLKTTGWFKYSRNPIYVVTIVGLIGWALITQSILVNVVLLLWATFYLIAPFLEEPWLESEYGEEYIAYKNQVRRFL